MILMYHKIYPESPTIWWVTPNAFWRQMEELRRYRVVPLDEYDPKDPNNVSITFDGVYENVYKFAFPILKKFGYPFELFIIGNFIGKDNTFDKGEPQAKFANYDQLKTMVNQGGRLQWHSWSHRDINKVTVREEIELELYIPEDIRQLDPKGFSWFAYPNGIYSSYGQDIIRKYFKGALLCDQGDNLDCFHLKRITVTNETRFTKSTVSLIIANYNYGRFAAEAIESAIHQTVQADEILFIDDFSEDNSLEVASRYKEKIKIIRNEKNLGIVDNFNKAVSLTYGDYICFLGADNRFRSDYIEKCKFALDTHPEAAIAYTNAIIFGPRAGLLAQKVGAIPISEAKDIFLWRFPEFNEESREILKTRNFIHGSSMYRRLAYEEVGGYIKSTGPEDHNLFYRMVDRGWKAILCPEFLLEYRQHSHEQANTQLNLGLELAFLRRQIKFLNSQLQNLVKEKLVIKETLEQAAIYARQNKIEEAIAKIRDGFRRFPEQGKLLLQYALLLKLRGMDDEAISLLDHVVLYDPDLVEYIEKFKSKNNLFPLKNYYENKNITHKLDAHYKDPFFQKLEHEQRLADEEYRRIQKMLDQGKAEGTVKPLEDFLKKFPDHALANNDLGVLYFTRGEIEKALQRLETAYRLNPQNLDIMKNLADAYVKQGNFEKSLEIYEKILSQCPQDLEVYKSLALIFSNLNRKEEALFWWNKVLEVDPTDLVAKDYIEKMDKKEGYQEIQNTEGNTHLGNPIVSIIIPVFNNLALTQNCLASIIKNTKEINYEIIVVDNGSTDGTKEYLQGMEINAIRPFFFNENKGFSEACNYGAKNARGEYIFFLNNDTEVKPGWLTSLIRFAESTPDCGAVGAKLVYPNGRLQEAGGIIFADGHGWNYGRGMDPSDPRFNFVREVDYCSGAALMVRKSLWDEIGGFDLRYSPAYYEDTDLCFEIRNRGYKVYYHPKSVVVHHEGKTAGVNLQSGYKKYQEINRNKFIVKWKEELKKQFTNDPANVVKASDRHAQKSILVIDAFLPFYDRASGSLRLFNILKLLKKMKFHITFLAGYNSLENQYRPILEEIGIEVYAGDYDAKEVADLKDKSFKSISYDLLFRNRSYDYALIEFWNVASYYLPLIRKFSPQTKIIIDSVDIHFIREIREAELLKSSELKRKALLNKDREIGIYKRADRIWVVTENDKKAIKDLIGNIPIDVIPNIHKNIEYVKTYEESSDLLFIGNFNHPPNRDAIHFFCKEIFSLILKKIPGVKLFIVGNNPSEEIKALASKEIIVTGYVQDLSLYLKKARISVNPLRYGAGMKGKIGEALSWGLPVVTTSIGAEGMELIDRKDALIADSPEEFAKKVIELYLNSELWNELSSNGRKKVEENWTPEVVNRKLEEIFVNQKFSVERNLVSIIIPVYNQLEYTKKCLESIFEYTDIPFELIIVDNGSTDDTLKYLEIIKSGKESIGRWRLKVGDNGEIVEKIFMGKESKKKKKIKKDFLCRGMKIISNERNLGFATGNNIAMKEAKGDYILLLNNDVVVTPGWLKRMINLAERKPEIGIVGPMSNYVAGPQLVKEVSYDLNNLVNLNQFAQDFANKNRGKTRPFWGVIGFCMLIKREVLKKIGGLDERFGWGNFEDIDYCLRARLAGYESWIAEDCFVHHFGNRTFSGEKIDYKESLKRNWEIFKRKWGIPQEIQYGESFDIELKERFNPLKHYFPIHPEKYSISKGEELFNAGDDEGAEVIFQKILSFDPKNIDALNNLGVLYFHRGDVNRAISYFQQVLELNENYFEALENLAYCMIFEDNFQEAMPLFKKALSFKPNDVNLLNSLATCLVKSKAFKEAEELYKKSYEINNNQPQLIEILNGIKRMQSSENQVGIFE